MGAHLQVILLTGLQGVAAKVRLELYVIFKGLIGGREGHRGEKLNRQTTKQNKNREEEEEEEEEPRQNRRGRVRPRCVTGKEKMGLKG